jgi:hypothetical protein
MGISSLSFTDENMRDVAWWEIIPVPEQIVVLPDERLMGSGNNSKAVPFGSFGCQARLIIAMMQLLKRAIYGTRVKSMTSFCRR